jgi:hypothetical protein
MTPGRVSFFARLAGYVLSAGLLLLLLPGRGEIRTAVEFRRQGDRQPGNLGFGPGSILDLEPEVHRREKRILRHREPLFLAAHIFGDS